MQVDSILVTVFSEEKLNILCMVSALHQQHNIRNNI